MTEDQLIERIRTFTRLAPRRALRIFEDTSEFMSIQADDVIALDGRHYLVRGEEMEGRFGLDGEPKFWVKRAVDLEDGSAKVIKLVFHESFLMRLGDLGIRCHRSPPKESRILDKVRGDRRFMQGITILDRSGNEVRIIDRIQGQRFYDFVNELEGDHEHYFTHHLPLVLRQVVACIEAIDRLHRMGEIHGDIRNDHILIERGSGLYRWIDFDYTYDWAENPWGVDLFGLGNVLLFAVGKGFHTVRGKIDNEGTPDARLHHLTAADCSLFFPHRVINLRKLFPYVPNALNQVLMHFASGAEVFYETTGELLQDLLPVLESLPAPGPAF